MTRTSALFTSGPLVATTTPAQLRKCRAVSKRGRPACQGNVNDAKAHSRYRFHSHRPGSGVRRQARGVDGKPAPNNFPGLTNVASKGFTCAVFQSISTNVFYPSLPIEKVETHENSGLIYSRLAVSCVIGSDNLPRIKREGREADNSRGLSLSDKSFS